MSRKRTGMKRKNFPGRKQRRRVEARLRLRKYAAARSDNKDEERIAHLRHLGKLIKENDNER